MGRVQKSATATGDDFLSCATFVLVAAVEMLIASQVQAKDTAVLANHMSFKVG